MNNFNVLSLDISSTTIGWSVISYNDSDFLPSLKDYGYIKPSKKFKNMTDRVVDLEEKIKDLCSNLEKIDFAIVEDYASFFKGGLSSAKTIITLALFNEFTKFFIFKNLGINPEKVSVHSIRSLVSKKYNAKVKGKEEVLDFVIKNFKNYKTKINKLKNIRKECNDEADAILVGLYYVLNEENKNGQKNSVW